MMDIKSIYTQKCYTHSDINEHLPTLYNLATNVDHITEFGTRHGNSTTAFLAAIENTNKHLVCYDLFKSDIINNYEQNFKNLTFIQNDTLNTDIKQTDFLFIDTLHTYYQLINELTKHSLNVTAYIALHDTVTYGEIDEPFYGYSTDIQMSSNVQKTIKQGLQNAIRDFLETEDGCNWSIDKVFVNNNGLTVLKRK